jgi:hypothetical protein
MTTTLGTGTHFIRIQHNQAAVCPSTHCPQTHIQHAECARNEEYGQIKLLVLVVTCEPWMHQRTTTQADL